MNLISRVRRHPHPVRFLASRVLARTGLCRLFTIQLDGFRLHFHPAAVPMTLWVNPDDLAEDTDFLKRFLKPGDRFVDVGANIGQLTVQAAICVQDRGDVIAIEAHPTTYKYLCENLTLNGLGAITAIHSAVGAAHGSIQFTSRRSDDQNQVSASGDIEVPLNRLDDLLPSGDIHLLKIDVEGYELFVLQGANNTLQHTHAVYFEAWDPLFTRHGYGFADVADVLGAAGFTLFSIHGQELRPFLQRSSPEFTNLLALKSLDFAIDRSYSI